MTAKHESSDSASEGDSGRIRLILVVGAEAGDVERCAAGILLGHPSYDVKILRVGDTVPSLMPWTDRVYAWLDKQVFGRRRRESTPLEPIADVTDLADLLKGFVPTAIVDLTGSFVCAGCDDDIPTIRVEFEGGPAGAIEQAVRRRIGVHQGTVNVVVRSTMRGVQSDLITARCFIDHRSLSRSVDLIINKVPRILQGALARMAVGDDVAAEPPVALPPPQRAFRLLWRLAGSIAQRLTSRDQWRILLYRDVAEGRLRAPWATLSPDAAAFWADPFVVPHERGVAVFLEELPFASGKGRISVIDVDSDGRKGALSTVLDQPWHLSYPFIFEWQGKHFMIPESSANKTVDLYECTEFPLHWRYVKTLISGVRLADATLIRWEGRWWMFAAHGDLGASNYDELHLFWADDVTGPWHAHVLNPVRIDAGSTRPAGAMFVANGRIVRPAQDCRNRYGDAVVFQEVLDLDLTHFRERTVCRLKPDGLAPDAACHTFNRAGRYAVIDAAESIRRSVRAGS